MKLEEALKIYKENYFRINKVYLLSPDVNGDFELTDQTCFYPTKEEWKAMKIIIDHFYKGLTEKEIEAHNNKNSYELYEEIAKPGTKSKRKSTGNVYLIKADNGLYKIGRTKNINQRLDHFTTKLPYKLELIHSIKSNEYNVLEKFFHDKFASKRKRGEWFDLSDSDIGEVKAYVGS